MKEKTELQDELLTDDYDMSLLIDYVKDDLMEDPYDQDTMDGLNYFLNNRGLEIHSRDELDCMEMIEEETEKYDELNDPSQLTSTAQTIAVKIVSMSVPMGALKDIDGKIVGNLNNSSISRESKQVTYAELDKMIGGSILCNNMSDRYGYQLELESGEMEKKDEFGRPTGDYEEILQWYIISDGGADFLKRCTDQIVFYDNELDIYVWGITHYGTSWNYVHTTITV